ncbi:hypothetical protein V866_008385 [Kwoniella sp. B9012]|uniref:Uncharacterized protein n=1 Tax=Kwoniella europaea PYCC6329 TaxID=1423913 RepID=A0AAX4KUZ9_9TREE
MHAPRSTIVITKPTADEYDSNNLGDPQVVPVGAELPEGTTQNGLPVSYVVRTTWQNPNLYDWNTRHYDSTDSPGSYTARASEVQPVFSPEMPALTFDERSTPSEAAPELLTPVWEDMVNNTVTHEDGR